MPQLFSPRADRRLRGIFGLAAAALVLGLSLAYGLSRSDGAWGVGTPAAQPIPFSHAIHAGSQGAGSQGEGGIGLDCRFCHATVERSASAGMPTAETCLGCHRQVWSVGAQFAPLRTALAMDTPVAWASVHRLPEHVRFHHAAHVTAGIGCAQCHGPVATMPRTVKTEPQSMGWCLDCHRGRSPGQSAYAHFGVEVPPLTRCSTCHR